MVKQAAEMSGASGLEGDLAWAYVKAQRPEEARKLLVRLEAEERKPATVIAGVYAVLGENEKALKWLERAYNERSGYLPAIRSDFIFESLRNEARYQALIEKMGLKKPT